jgi:putative transposase
MATPSRVDVPETVIADLEGDLEHLNDLTVARVLDELASYASVEPAALRVSVGRNLTIAVRALRAGVPPAVSDLDEAEKTTRERFAVGIPVEEILRAFRVSISIIQERFVERCFAEGVPAERTLAGSGLLWAVGDVFMTRVVTAYHNLELDDAVQDAQRRTDHVRALLAGHLNLTESAPVLAGYRIDPDGQYAAIRCVVRGAGSEKLRREIERLGSHPDRPALVAVDAGECIGVVSRRPAEVPGQVIGIGPLRPLREAASSFAMATRCCEVARRTHSGGVFGLEDLTWRLAAADQPEVTTYLRDRYLAPLRAEGEFGAVLEETLRAFLARSRNVARTAEELVLHVNTLRYRIRRFEELVGASLDSPDTLVELHWTLELPEPGSRTL